MAFRGWPVEAIEFYEGLEADNSKVYWQDHKAVYERAVAGPMAELLTELAAEFGEGRIFRPYRDVRFSADKSPYKTAIAAELSHGGYIQLSSDGLAAGSGSYHMASDQLDRYRRAVADDRTGAALALLVDAAGQKGIEVTAHESLKSAPRGYAKDHPRLDLLRLKGLVTWKQWPVAAWLGTAQSKKRLVEFFRSSQPLKDWLAANVGESTMPDHRRP
ncbi:MAG TPA: DUF2461 domain-containing protein [Acidimicrobiales bacterium]